MHLLPALVVGLTAGLLAVQDCKDEKWTKEKEPESGRSHIPSRSSNRSRTRKLRSWAR